MPDVKSSRGPWTASDRNENGDVVADPLAEALEVFM
jgi:hypothetical protein